MSVKRAGPGRAGLGLPICDPAHLPLSREDGGPGPGAWKETQSWRPLGWREEGGLQGGLAGRVGIAGKSGTREERRGGGGGEKPRGALPSASTQRTACKKQLQSGYPARKKDDKLDGCDVAEEIAL